MLLLTFFKLVKPEHRKSISSKIMHLNISRFFTVTIGVLLLNNCGAGGPGFGTHATTSNQGNGIQHISLTPHSFKTQSQAIEAFHHSAQKSQPSGSYRYRYDITKRNQARSSSGSAAIPYGVGPGAALGMIAGNIVALNQEKPAVISVSGYTYPQKALSLKGKSNLSLHVTSSSDPIEAFGKENLQEIKNATAKALASMGYNIVPRAKQGIKVEVFRAAQEHSWTTLELSLLTQPNRKAFVIAKAKKGSSTTGEFHDKLAQSLNNLISLR